MLTCLHVGFIPYFATRYSRTSICETERMSHVFCMPFVENDIHPPGAGTQTHQKFMKTKFMLLALFLLMGTSVSFAQITTGKPTSKEIRTGNRAQAGDFGLYMGVTSNMFKDMFDGDVQLQALPLINFKYMVSDRFETRLGLELYKASERLKGDVLSEVDEGETYFQSNKYGRSQAMFYPGIAYHFSKRNLLDVYVGAELPIGWNSNRSLMEADDVSQKITKNSFVIGLGAFIGLQAYIADLPLAIGVEYGLSSRFDAKLKYKCEMSEDGQTQTYYVPDLSAFKNLATDAERFDKLKAKKGEIGSQFRLTLTYYFK